MKKGFFVVVVVLGLLAIVLSQRSRSVGSRQDVVSSLWRVDSVVKEKNASAPVTEAKAEMRMQPLLADADSDVREARKISRKYVLSSADQSALRELLRKSTMKEYVRNSLRDRRMLEHVKVRERFHALDILYEGVKNSDAEVQQEYLAIAGSVLAEPLPADINADSYEGKQFLGDRAEIALVLLKIPSSKAKKLVRGLNLNSKTAANYFVKAKQLSRLYRVTL